MADNLKRIKNAFLLELKLASKGEKSSLSYIKHVLPDKPLIQRGLAEAVVIGGTNFEFATIRVNENRDYEVIRHTKGVLPVLDTASTLISVFEKNLNPAAEAVSVNFAFPLDPALGRHNELDGRFIKGTKEHTIRGLIGHPVGEFLKKNVYKKEIPITVANDTVCLSLSGDGVENAAMILGTGFNMSLNLFEKGKSVVVNLEAGNFNGIDMTYPLSEIDKNSENPKEHIFEKAVSGAYLIKHFQRLAKQMNLPAVKINDTRDLSALAARPKTKSGKLAIQILNQSASYTASVIAGLYEFLGEPEKIEIITEGSLFWKGFNFRQSVELHLREFGIKKNAAIFKHVDSSSLKGAINLLLRKT